jgi:hypothetical protein
MSTATANPGTAAGGLVTAKGTPMPPTPTALQQQAEIARRKHLEQAWKHYRGDIAGPFRAEPGQPNVNVLTNRMSSIVDTGVDFLCGRPVVLKVDEKTKQADKVQAVLDGCWGNPRRKATLLAKLAQNGGIFGHVFAKIIPPDPAKGRPYCRVVPLDPSQCRVDTDPMDCDTVLCYTIEWNATDVYGQHLSRRQVIQRVDPDDDADEYDRGEDPDSTWQITNWQRGSSASASWVLVGEPEEWPHPWAPIVDWQNQPLANEHWGTEDIPPDVMHLNSVLNFVLSNVNSIGKSHGMPWLYSSGVGPTDVIKAEPGKLIQLHSPDAKISALEAHGDLAGLMAFAKDLRSSIDEQSRVPGVATGRIEELPRLTSGVAIRLLYQPLLSKNLHKQNTYGEGYCTLSTRMLALCGFGDGTEQNGVAVDAHWQDPMPTDDLAMAQTAVIKRQLGFSQRTLIEELGGDFDVEQDKQDAIDAHKVVKFSRGQGMPPPMQQPGMPMQPGDPSQQPGQQPQQQGQGNGGNLPPVNHPAAQAARAAATAAGKAMKGAQ